MTDRKETKLFAFKLAEKQAQEAKPVPQFKVRDGVAVAACTGPDVLENWREFTSSWQGDKGTYC
jgi:hypothetical protein